MNKLQLVDLETIERLIQDWDLKQNHLPSTRNQLDINSIEIQELFQRWIGIEPSAFFQLISAEQIKNVLGLYKPGLFISPKKHPSTPNIPEEHYFIIEDSNKIRTEEQNGFEMSYAFIASPFGRVLLACTNKGVCHIAFLKSEQIELAHLKLKFPNAHFIEQDNDWFSVIHQYINSGNQPNHIIPLHIQGTAFQIQVWKQLLKIPFGQLKTYNMISRELLNPNGSRAVGKAVGANPIAYLIPCHRVVPSTGIIGNYMWGKEKKKAIIGWEMYHSM